MNNVCRKCKKAIWGKGVCSLGYRKTEDQLRAENYSCYEQVHYWINEDTDNVDELYGKPLSDKDIALRIRLLRSERGLETDDKKLCEAT